MKGCQLQDASQFGNYTRGRRGSAINDNSGPLLRVKEDLRRQGHLQGLMLRVPEY